MAFQPQRRAARPADPGAVITTRAPSCSGRAKRFLPLPGGKGERKSNQFMAHDQVQSRTGNYPGTNAKKSLSLLRNSFCMLLPISWLSKTRSFHFRRIRRVKFRRSAPVPGRSKHKLPSRQSVSHPPAPPSLLRPRTGALRVRKFGRPKKFLPFSAHSKSGSVALLLVPVWKDREERAGKRRLSQMDGSCPRVCLLVLLNSPTVSPRHRLFLSELNANRCR